MRAGRAVGLCVAVMLSGPVWLIPPASSANQISDSHTPSPDTGPDAHHDVSRPLRELAPAPYVARGTHPDSPLPTPPASTVGDPAVQTAPATASAPSATNNFPGVGNGFSGPQGTFAVKSAPPDTTGAVGPTDYVQVVNSDLAIFAKSTGAVIYGPVPTNTLWSGFGGYCQTTNDGDATVKYDGQADRWVVTQFANVSSNTGPFYQCVAVSTTGDPTGTYRRYAFQFADFPDYGKLSVWSDGYYITFNMFSAGPAGTFQGAQSCVWERAAMLSGATARQVCYMTSPAYGGLLAADLDGPTPPPAGEANTQVALGNTSTTLANWSFHIDWTSGASTFTQNPNLIVDSYTQACNGGTCIPQPGTTNTLDSLADRLMYRLQYRNFGDHESLVVDDSVNVNSTQGVRWYELRLNGGTPVVWQQGTFSPDATSRWMGSAAMDGSGDIAIGYSTSSTGQYPSIAYAGRLAGDSAGTLSQGEAPLIAGSGSQTGGLTRWGDYSTMSVDPTDNCTFWYTNEYLPGTGSFNWRTQIGSFKFPTCNPGPGAFTMSASPASATAPQGGTATYTVSTATVQGSTPAAVTLTELGAPSGSSVSFSGPNPAVPPTSSMLTVNLGPSTPPGTYPITIKGSTTTTTQTVTVSLVVSPTPGTIANGNFESGLSGWTTGGVFAPTSSTVQANSPTHSALLGASSTPEPNGDSSLAQTVSVPTSGTTTLSFWYWPHTADTITYDWQEAQVRNTSGATLASIMKIDSNTQAWTQKTFDLTPYAGQTVSLWFNVHGDGYGDLTYLYIDDVTLANSTPAFTISATPATGTAAQGASATYTVNTAQTGAAGNVALSAAGLPSGATASFNPATVAAGGSSTMTVTNGWTTPTGTSTVTITGNENGGTQSTTVSHSVTASDFSVGASPSSVSAADGASVTSTISTVLTSGVAQTVALTASGVPSGATASFSPTSVTAGGTSSTLTLAAGSASPGTYPVTVTGTGQSTTHTATVSFTVTAGPSDFGITISPQTASIAQGGSSSHTVNLSTIGAPGTVTLSTSSSRAGLTATLVTSSPSTSNPTLTITADWTASPGPYTLTVTGTEPSSGGPVTHSFDVGVTVTASTFTIAASPSSVSAQQGHSASTTISTAVTAGPAQSVSFSTGLLPSGISASFNPTSVTAGSSSTLTLSAATTAVTGSYTITVTGTGSTGAQQSTTVTFTVIRRKH